jgi:hypothetical protein
MSGGKGCLGCLGALLGILGFFLAITLSFTFYLIPVAFLVFIGSLILISLAFGAPPSSGPEKKNSEPPEKGN